MFNPRDPSIDGAIVDAGVEPSGIPGEGQKSIPPQFQRAYPPGFDNQLSHRIFDMDDIVVPVGQHVAFMHDAMIDYWIVRFSSVASQVGTVYISSGPGGTGFVLRTDGHIKVPARGKHLTIQNNGATIITGTLIALAGFDFEYEPGSAT